MTETTPPEETPDPDDDATRELCGVQDTDEPLDHHGVVGGEEL